jgi:hypothetical protein
MAAEQAPSAAPAVRTISAAIRADVEVFSIFMKTSFIHTGKEVVANCKSDVSYCILQKGFLQVKNPVITLATMIKFGIISYHFEKGHTVYAGNAAWRKKRSASQQCIKLKNVGNIKRKVFFIV